MSDRAERIRENATFEVECPSWNRYLLRMGSSRDVMMLTGEIPVDPEFIPEGMEADQEDGAAILSVQARQAENTKLLVRAEFFCREWVVDPIIDFTVKHDEKPADKDAVGHWEVPAKDLTHMFLAWVRVSSGRATREQAADYDKYMKFFRDGLGTGESGRPGTEVLDEAEQSGGDKG